MAAEFLYQFHKDQMVEALEHELASYLRLPHLKEEAKEVKAELERVKKAKVAEPNIHPDGSPVPAGLKAADQTQTDEPAVPVVRDDG